MIFKCLVFILLFPVMSYACVIEGQNRHFNPDGTLGGMVSLRARVSPLSYVSYNAKVCDQAVIEENVSILDSAIVEGKAWIRQYSSLSGNSVVNGNATTLGSRYSRVIIKDFAKVSGNAKVLTGSVISENSLITDNAEIKDVKMYGDAQVCGYHKLRSVTVSDDLYCNKEEMADADLTLSNFSSNEFNIPRSLLIFQIKNSSFSFDSSKYQIVLNEKKIPAEDLYINSSAIKVLNVESDSWKNGVNFISFVGRDATNKILVKEFFFYVGKNVKQIAIPGLNSSFKIKVRYQLDSKEYNAHFEVLNDKLILNGLPGIEGLDKIIIEGVSEESFLYEEFSGGEVPDEILISSLPPFLNNDYSFDNLYNNWKISHPDLVTVLDYDQRKRIQFYRSSDSRVEVAKSFKLLNDINGIMTRFNFIPARTYLFTESPSLDLFFISKKDRHLKHLKYSPLVASDISNSLDFHYVKEKYEDVALVVRVNPGIGSNLDGAVAEMETPESSKVTITFKPRDFFSRNLRRRPRNSEYSFVPSSQNISPSECQLPIFDFQDQRWQEVESEIPSLNYFSVGPLGTLEGKIRGNRIYGDILIKGISSQIELLSVDLIGFQSGLEVFKKEWSTCLKEEVLRTVSTSEYSENKSFNFLTKNNLVKFAFEIPFLDLININTSKGSSINLKVRLTYKSHEEIKTYTSSVDQNFPVLISTPLANSQVILNSIDTYDISGVGYLRTGGDKWALPAYGEKIHTFLNYNSGWQANDISKLNGGKFPPHDGHIDGRDADIKHQAVDGVQHNFFCYTSDSQWVNSLDRIENLIKINVPEFKYIDKILLSKEGKTYDPPSCAANSEENKKWEFSSKFVEGRFDYRCLGTEINGETLGRYVDLNNNGIGKSLVVHHISHADHLHLKYNELNARFDVLEKSLDLPSVFDLTHFKFSIDTVMGTISVAPMDEFEHYYGTTSVLVRLQDNIGFRDPNNNVIFGSWEHSSKIRDNTSFDFIGVKYLYITVINKVTGACLGLAPVALDFGNLSNSQISRKDFSLKRNVLGGSFQKVSI